MLSVCLGAVGVFPDLELVVDEIGRDKFVIAPRDLYSTMRAPGHPFRSWAKQVGRSWNYWRGRNLQYSGSWSQMTSNYATSAPAVLIGQNPANQTQTCSSSQAVDEVCTAIADTEPPVEVR